MNDYNIGMGRNPLLNIDKISNGIVKAAKDPMTANVINNIYANNSIKKLVDKYGKKPRMHFEAPLLESIAVERDAQSDAMFKDQAGQLQNAKFDTASTEHQLANKFGTNSKIMDSLAQHNAAQSGLLSQQKQMNNQIRNQNIAASTDALNRNNASMVEQQNAMIEAKHMAEKNIMNNNSTLMYKGSQLLESLKAEDRAFESTQDALKSQLLISDRMSKMQAQLTGMTDHKSPDAMAIIGKYKQLENMSKLIQYNPTKRGLYNIVLKELGGISE